MNILPLAQGWPEDVFPFLIGALVFMIPIIAILTQHQRKMALIMRGQDEEGRPIKTNSIDKLEQDMRELRQLVAQQAITLDNVCENQKRLLETMQASDEIRSRIGPQ